MLVKLLKERKAYLTHLNSKCRSFLKKAPGGSLRISSSHGCTYYYYRSENSLKETPLRKKDDLSLIQNLARKDYYENLSEEIERELFRIDSLLKIKEKESIANVFIKLHPARQELVKQVEPTLKQRLSLWINMEELQSEPEPGRYFIPTQRGENVRSKNEYIIANALFKHGIPYKYEFPYKAVNGRILHPDFYVFNRTTGQEFYWEHFGMMDNPEYVINSMMYKINLYKMDDIIIGKNLIATFSGGKYEFSESDADQMIETYLL